MSSMDLTPHTGTEILIVEDSATQALRLQSFLEEKGYTVQVSCDGKEALSFLQTQIPKLVISDIMMPEMDGYELCRHIKSNDRLKDLPVILLTALSDPEDVIKALECGADNFVTKPYEEELLTSRIRSILLNKELRKSVSSEAGIEIYFAGKKHVITSSRMQIIDLLFSTYENAVQKNLELKQVNKELTSAHRELERRNVDLEKLNMQKNQFLGMAAHDLRSPLGIIFNFSEILLEEVFEKLEEEQSGFLSVIKSSSEFMLRLVDEFLDVAKIESGKLELNLQPTDIFSIVKQNVSLNGIFATKKDIELILSCEDDFPSMLLDSAKIEQVLNNFISNAIKFSHPKSKVKIQLSRHEDHMMISVTDEGQGIPEKELDKLFKPFGQTSVKTTGGEKSTGLGLAIVKKIVEGHKGKIWVESEVGKGSTFHVSLPIVVPVYETGKVPVPPRHSTSQPTEVVTDTRKCEKDLKILVTDDNTVNQLLIKKILEKQGYTVMVAGNGKEAIEVYEKEVPDLILMDVQMPEMNGCEATAAIRQKEKETQNHIPIVAITAHSAKEEFERCVEAGMDGYVTKPIKSQELIEVIEQQVSV
ncbi:MAG: response regulator [Thermodesulfobacteriota bacterium]|nr:response regulator [Thermodesulfobacteriota bacterium]